MVDQLHNRRRLVKRAREARGQRAWRLGVAAEDAVEDYLWARGYEIVGRNIRVGSAEIDILARRGHLVVVVEVRTRGRGAWQSGWESISRAKRQRLRGAGQRLWAERFERDSDVDSMRFDAAVVHFEHGAGTSVEYVEGAF